MLKKDWIPVLLGALAFSFPSVALALEECFGDDPCDTGGGFLMEEVEELVEETSSRRRQFTGKSPSSVTVITREDIEASGATSIPDLLRLVPGMDVVKITPFYTSVSSRLHHSDESSNFLVLVDGQEVNLDFIGLMPWSLQAIALDDVERIEVVRGPMSVLYGGGALAGVIHIFTRMVPRDTSAWVQAEGGEVNSLWAGARASARVGRKFRLSVWGGGSRMGNYDEPLIEGMRSWKLRAAAEYRFLDNVYLRFDGSMSEGSGRFYSKLGPFDGTLEQRTLRLAYRSPRLSGQLHWSQTPVTARLDSTMSFAGLTLATFAPLTFDVHTLIGDVQYTLPEFSDLMSLMMGGQVRLQWLDCDRCLNAETYTDISNEGYRQPGVDTTEVRAGAFVNVELKPSELIVASAGFRMDYDTAVGPVVSVRLASVFIPADRQHLRFGLGRSWRRSAFLEDDAHMMAEFPDESPITGPSQDAFQEFMTRVYGGGDPRADAVLSVDASYLGQFFDQRLSVFAGFFYNSLTVRDYRVEANIIPDVNGLPDMQVSSFMFSRGSETVEALGIEAGVKYEPKHNYLLQAWWVHRVAPKEYRGDLATASSPADLLAFGGRAKTELGILGSCYFFYRSAVRLKGLPNPNGLLGPSLISNEDMNTAFLLIGKLGWMMSPGQGVDLEMGVKVFLPISFSSPHFHYREGPGWEFPTVGSFGAQELGRMVIGYFQGSF